MKAFISACALCGLIWLPAGAQRGGFVRAGFVSQPGATSPGRPTRPPGRGAGYGFFPGAWSDTGGYGYQAAPSTVVVMPQIAPPPLPVRPVQGEIRDYTKTNPPETASGPPAEFSVVGKDRVAHAAVAVWAQEGVLHYVDAEGAGGAMPLGAVDREATRAANSAKGLRLQIPAE